MEVAALVVAFVGLAMSLYNFFYEKHKNRFKVEMKLMDVIVPRNASPMFDILFLQIVNKSKEPISVTALNTECEGRHMCYGNVRQELQQLTSHSGEKTFHDFWHSDVLPVRIDGLGAVRVLLVADNGKRNFNHTDKICFELCTNKGVAKFAITVSDVTENFGDEKLLLQCRAPDLRR